MARVWRTPIISAAAEYERTISPATVQSREGHLDLMTDGRMAPYILCPDRRSCRRTQGGATMQTLILEIRAAEGGADAQLFTQDLAASYGKLFAKFG